MEDSHFVEHPFLGSPDRLLAGVFDGHSGKQVAERAREEIPTLVARALQAGSSPADALRRAFLDFDASTKDLTSGSTAVVLLLDDRRLSVANAGDSHLTLVTRSGARILTEDHRVTNPAELERCKAAGAEIDGPYICIPDTDYGVMCTRALGDHKFKPIGQTPEPAIREDELPADAIFLVVACDGLYDVMNAEEIGGVARRAGGPEEACRALHHEALEVRGTTDNLTIVVIDVRGAQQAK